MKIVKANKDDINGINQTKDNFFKFYEKIMSEAQASNPDTLHDIFLNQEGPSTENQLEGQRFTKNKFKNSPPDNTVYREFDGQVGMPTDTGTPRNKFEDVGQTGKEIPVPFKGDAAGSQYEAAGGSASTPEMVGDQVLKPELETNYMQNSLGPDSANTLEKQLNNDNYGKPPSITNNKNWFKDKVVGPPVSKKKRTKKER